MAAAKLPLTRREGGQKITKFMQGAHWLLNDLHTGRYQSAEKPRALN